MYKLTFRNYVSSGSGCGTRTYFKLNLDEYCISGLFGLGADRSRPTGLLSHISCKVDLYHLAVYIRSLSISLLA